jgi:DNA-binding NtrC family response regulator
MKSKSMLLVKGFNAQAQPQEQLGANSRLDLLIEAFCTLLHEVKALKGMPPVKIEAGVDFYQEVQSFEALLIRRALEATGGSQVRAASLLGLKLSTLNGMIKRYRISLSVLAETETNSDSAGHQT